MPTRPATETDWPHIENLLKALRLPLDGARDHLQHYRIIEQDGETLAIGGLETYGEHALLRSMAVQENHQKSGLGRVLTEDLIQHARNLNIKHLYLLTTTAAGYFPRYGFQEISREQLPEALQASQELRGACPSSAVVMHLSL